jgi:transcriptional regulator with XRE-family HTH domain
MCDQVDIKRFRERYDMTQAELADKLAIDRSTLAHVERGRRSLSRPSRRLFDQMLETYSKDEPA